MPSPEASRRNLEKGRARWRAPRPWRSAQETRVIKLLVWQWFAYRGPGKWSARAVGRRLGVSHTYVQKLVREFGADPSGMLRELRSSYLATFDQLSRAQEETRQQRERGWLRPPRRWRVAEFRIGDQMLRTVVPTKAEERRKSVAWVRPRWCGKPASGELTRGSHGVPIWATGMTYYSAENPCDPLIAVKYAMQQGRERRPVFVRRWRPGRS